MHQRAESFVAAANDRYGFDPDVTEFDAGTRTADDAAAAIGCRVAQIASSLVFSSTEGLVVVVTSGANRVDEAHVAAVHGVESLEMADAERIKDELGWSIGVGHLQRIDAVDGGHVALVDTVRAGGDDHDESLLGGEHEAARDLRDATADGRGGVLGGSGAGLELGHSGVEAVAVVGGGDERLGAWVHTGRCARGDKAVTDPQSNAHLTLEKALIRPAESLTHATQRGTRTGRRRRGRTGRMYC